MNLSKTHLIQSIKLKASAPSKPNMSSQPMPLLPYRDVNNHSIAYTPAPGVTSMHNASYDSDFEPLIDSNPVPEPLDEDSFMRFTATGRPMPGFKASALANMSGDMFSVPQLLPKRYTDDSIIPAIIVDVIPAQKLEVTEKKSSKRGSFMKILKGEREAGKNGNRNLTKVVFMPRRDYLKWFARDLKGAYIGSEPYRQWREEELEEQFKQYKPRKVDKKKPYLPSY